MRVATGYVALDSLYVAIGYAWLFAFGVVDTGVRAVRELGLALIAGWSVVGVLLTWALCAGAPDGFLTTAAVAGIAVGGAALFARSSDRRRVARRGVEQLDRLEIAVVVASVGVVAVVVGAKLVQAVAGGADETWDAWAFWVPKARSIYTEGGLSAAAGGVTSFANPEYPPLLPATTAASFHFTSDTAAVWLPVQQCVLGAAFVGAAASLLLRRAPAVLVAAGLALLVASPAFSDLFDSVIADQQVAYLLALAAMAFLLSLHSEDDRWLLPAAIFLAAAAVAKSEGFLLGLLLALAVVADRPWSSRPLRLLLPVVPLAAIAPWWGWLAAHGQQIQSQLYSWTSLLHPHHLSARAGRLHYAVDSIARVAVTDRRWLFLIPIAALLALVPRAQPRAPGLALWFVVGFAGLATTYWISTAEIHYHVNTSIRRVMTSFGTVAGATLPLLLTSAFAEPTRSRPRTTATKQHHSWRRSLPTPGSGSRTRATAEGEGRS